MLVIAEMISFVERFSQPPVWLKNVECTLECWLEGTMFWLNRPLAVVHHGQFLCPSVFNRMLCPYGWERIAAIFRYDLANLAAFFALENLSSLWILPFLLILLPWCALCSVLWFCRFVDRLSLMLKWEDFCWQERNEEIISFHPRIIIKNKPT